MLWAACNGNEEVVRLLVNKGACDPYLSKDVNTEGKNEEEADPFRKPEDAKKIGKYTPLHWVPFNPAHPQTCR